MSTPGIVLWIVAGLLFLAAVAAVIGAVRATWRRMGRLVSELGGLSEDVEAVVGSRAGGSRHFSDGTRPTYH
jgi:hypothetical protein